jgi:predicted acylesterase/phospholipase RssA
MSIPYYFASHEHEGEPIYDGGLLANFPLDTLLDANRDLDFIGLYLKEAPPSWLARLTPFTLIRIMLSRNERELVKQYEDRIIVIDPFPIGLTQFKLTETEKDFLVWSGRAAAIRFLAERSQDPAMSVRAREADVKLQGLRSTVVRSLRLRRARRVLAVALGVVLLVALGLLAKG